MSFFSGSLGAMIDRGLIINTEVAPPPPELGYADIVTGLAGGGPLLYWRRKDASLLTDVVGTRHATITGTVVELAGLPENSDESMDFGGLGVAARAHDAGLVLSAFSLSFWFTMNSPTGEDIFFPMIRKRISPVATGDMVIYIDDAPNLIVRFRDGSGVNQELASLVLLEVGVTYHVCVRADGTGFDLFINGQLQGKSTGYLGAWSVNSREIGLADDPFFTVDADVTLDEIALYPRVVTTANVLTLAQNTDLPVAVADGFQVDESATTVLNVVANDTFVGAKADLTVTIVSKTAVTSAGHDVTVNANKDMAYVASAVTADEATSFTYKIQDVNGESNTVTCSVTVKNVSAPPVESAQANCFVESSANDVIVTSMAELQAEINVAPAGRQILIAAGTYTGGSITFNRDGTEANPIVIRPQNGLGTVTINNASWSIPNTASWITLSKLYFSSSNILLEGDHNRITRCRFRNLISTIRVGTNNESSLGARNCRIDHCDFGVSLATSVLNIIQIEPGQLGAGNTHHLLIDYCYFHDFNPVESTAGIPHVINTNSTTSTIDLPAGTSQILDHCLFENINVPRTGEFCMWKWGGHITRFCTFLNIGNHVHFRMCENNELRSCWFENVQDTRTFGANHLIIGNRFIGAEVCCAPPGNGTKAQMESGSAPLSRYMACTNSEFIGNRFGSGTIQLGRFPGSFSGLSPALSIPANNLLLEANTRDSGSPAHTFHTDALNPGATNVVVNSTTSVPFVPAVKLTSSDVGLLAGDPLCD